MIKWDTKSPKELDKINAGILNAAKTNPTLARILQNAQQRQADPPYKEKVDFLKKIWETLNKELKIECMTDLSEMPPYIVMDKSSAPNLLNNIYLNIKTPGFLVLTLYITDSKLYVYTVNSSDFNESEYDITTLEFDLSDPKIFENAPNDIRKMISESK